MPAVVTLDCCIVCGKNFTPMHSHHTTPRCRGGEDSPQVILCSNHHNSLHAHASFLVSVLKNPNRKRGQKTFWETSEYESRAAPLVKLLVQSFLQEKSLDQPHQVSFTLVGEEVALFKRLAADLGCSQEQAARYVMLKTLQARYQYDQEKLRTTMWFMPVSGKGKSV